MFTKFLHDVHLSALGVQSPLHGIALYKSTFTYLFTYKKKRARRYSDTRCTRVNEANTSRATAK